jgi:thioredoxin
MNISDFQQRVSSADKPVVVDFWAPWCVPCRMTKPILEKLAAEYGSRVTFLPVNANEARDVLEHFQITGIPTVLTMRDGVVVARVTGARNETSYRAMFETLANGGDVPRAISPFDRTLRLGAGALLGLAGFSTGIWILAGLGGLIAFLGLYDRCPIWRAITGMIRRRKFRACELE